MSQDIKFSIIIPFYNSKAYIERAILSVVNQTYDNWELIAVNDGSLDCSDDIVQKYAAVDNRIRIIRKTNGGYATAINYGLDHLASDSDYFLMLGSDDELDTSLLFSIVFKVKDKQFDMIGFKTIKINEEDGAKEFEEWSYVEGDVSETNVDINTFYKNNKIPHLFFCRDTSRCYRTEKLKGLRYFGRYGIDADGIFSALFAYQSNSFAHFCIDGYIWHYRKDSVSSTINEDKRWDSFVNWNSFFSVFLEKKY